MIEILLALAVGFLIGRLSSLRLHDNSQPQIVLTDSQKQQLVEQVQLSTYHRPVEEGTIISPDRTGLIEQRGEKLKIDDLLKA